MLFFVATVGRSGSHWLCHLLGQSPTHRVVHEKADPHFGSAVIPGWSPFPLARFLENGPDYGEVHGFLRYYLSPEFAGLERSIPRRAVLERNTRAVIRSWMRNGGSLGPRPDDEFAAVCFEVLNQQRLLHQWAKSDPGARLVCLETLTTDLDALRAFCDWLEIDLRPGRADQADARNVTGESLPDWEWTFHHEDVLQRLARRMNFEPITTP